MANKIQYASGLYSPFQLLTASNAYFGHGTGSDPAIVHSGTLSDGVGRHREYGHVGSDLSRLAPLRDIMPSTRRQAKLVR